MAPQAKKKFFLTEKRISKTSPSESAWKNECKSPCLVLRVKLLGFCLLHARCVLLFLLNWPTFFFSLLIGKLFFLLLFKSTEIERERAESENSQQQIEQKCVKVTLFSGHTILFLSLLVSNLPYNFFSFFRIGSFIWWKKRLFFLLMSSVASRTYNPKRTIFCLGMGTICSGVPWSSFRCLDLPKSYRFIALLRGRGIESKSPHHYFSNFK